MTRIVHRIEIDRVVVRGAAGFGLAAAELRTLVEGAVRQALAGSALPNARSVRASVQVSASSLASGGAIATAVGNGVARAIGGGRARG